MIPPEFAQYVGLPYTDKGRDRSGADCWGGVRLVLRELYAMYLPDYSDAYTSADDVAGASAALTAGLAENWRVVKTPQPGDLLIVDLGGKPWHCGLMVNALQFLHWPPHNKQGTQQFSSIERIDSILWSARQKRFYRYAG